MAVAFDAATESSTTQFTTSTTWAHNGVTALTNGFVAVWICSRNGAYPSYAVTYAGTTMTFLGSFANSSQGIGIYVLPIGNATANGTVSVTGGSSTFAWGLSQSFQGAAQTVTWTSGTNYTGTIGSGQPASLTLTVPTNGILAAGLSNQGTGAISTFTGTIDVSDTGGSGTKGHTAACGHQTANTATWVMSATNNYGVGALVLSPAATATAHSLVLPNRYQRNTLLRM